MKITDFEYSSDILGYSLKVNGKDINIILEADIDVIGEKDGEFTAKINKYDADYDTLTDREFDYIDDFIAKNKRIKKFVLAFEKANAAAIADDDEVEIGTSEDEILDFLKGTQR